MILPLTAPLHQELLKRYLLFVVAVPVGVPVFQEGRDDVVDARVVPLEVLRDLPDGDAVVHMLEYDLDSFLVRNELESFLFGLSLHCWLLLLFNNRLDLVGYFEGALDTLSFGNSLALVRDGQQICRATFCDRGSDGNRSPDDDGGLQRYGGAAPVLL